MEGSNTKRYALYLELDNSASEPLLVILKNPSRATTQISDKTVYNVSNYIYKNHNKHEALKSIGSISIVNLMPHYQTHSHLLQKQSKTLVDSKNFETIDTLCRHINTVIIAWGNAPKGLDEPYERMKAKTLNILKTHKNRVYYVKQLSAAGNPRHGQVWAYKDPLIDMQL